MEFQGPELVKIRRNPKVGYFGIVSYPNSVTTICCQIGNKGAYNTGLSPEEEAYYESKLSSIGVKPGDLGKHSKWWEYFNTELGGIRLFNTKATELMLDNEINQLKYKVLLANDKVAKSEIERNKPGIQFYIDDEEAKAKDELKTLNFELEGMKLILELTPEEVKGSLRLFGKAGLDLMSTSTSQAQLMQEMKKNPKNFFDIMKDKDLSTKMFVQELVERKLITRKGNYYIHGDDTIANTTNEAVEYFNDSKNQSVKLALETRLKKLKK